VIGSLAEADHAGRPTAGGLFATLGALLLAACGSDAPSEGRPPFVLRAVVAPAVAELEARIAAPRAPGEPEPGTRERLEGLLTMLEDPASDLRQVALEDAASLGDPAVALAAAALDDAAAPLARRHAAASVLGAIATPRASEALCATLEANELPGLRARCALELGHAGQDALLLRMLLRLKKETDGETVVWLAEALAGLGSHAGLDGLLVVRAGGASEDVRALAAERLAELARAAEVESPEALLARWNSPRAGELARRAPSDALALEVWRAIARLAEWNLRTVDDSRFELSRSGPWVAELLARALHDENRYVRVHAAQCLERMGPRAAAAGPELVLALGEPELAAHAAAALGGIAHAPAAPELARLVDGPADLDLRIAAAAALGHLAGAAPRAALERALAEGQALDLRQAAAQALLALGAARPSARFLCERLTDPAADPGAAEDALANWLALLAEGDEPTRGLFGRWRALGPAPGLIPSASEAQARQRARAELLAPELGRLEAR